ncbi:uncharacterized protein LOC143460548 isoform X2 [Clavelina lepadiformis]|uniref:uncharacterized protein LOC143460548 isoform X2 n=1 Tax=Clavelina lepadiformis TaxID=159417 RepID=UPI0040422CE1
MFTTISGLPQLTLPKTQQNTNNKDVLEEYPELKDTLEHVKSTIQTMLCNKEADVLKKNMNLSSKKSLDDLYNNYFEYDNPIHRTMIGDTLAKSGASLAFLDYLNILTSDGNDYPMEGYKYQCLEILRGVCWNYTDTSWLLCEEFGRVGILPIMMKDLKKFQSTFKTNSKQNFIAISAMSVLHNCARHSNNMKYYREMNAYQTVAWYAKNTDEKDALGPLSIMTLAYIVDEKNNDIIAADDTIIKTILKLLFVAAQSKERRCDGFSAEELTEGLTKLASNADNSVVIVRNGILKSISILLRSGNQTEKTAAANAIWVLAFTDQNKDVIKAEKEIIDTLKSMATSKESRKLAKSAVGALWVLKLSKKQSFSLSSLAKPKKKSKTKVETEKEIALNEQSLDNLHTDFAYNDSDNEGDEGKNRPTDDMASHVMISYQWDCQKLIVKVKDKLESTGYKVWIDLDEMGGSTLQSMAEAVEKASVILMCISQKYKDSVNCRTEAEYAYKLTKPVIPLLVEQNFKPDGWLGAIVGAKYYLDFSNLMLFEKTISNLLREMTQTGIRKRTSKTALLDTVRQPAKTAQDPQKLIKNWTKVDASNWAKENGLKKLNCQHLDGNALMFLRRIKHEAPEFFYRYVTEQLGLKNIQDLMNFTNALNDMV